MSNETTIILKEVFNQLFVRFWGILEQILGKNIGSSMYSVWWILAPIYLIVMFLGLYLFNKWWGFETDGRILQTISCLLWIVMFGFVFPTIFVMLLWLIF